MKRREFILALGGAAAWPLVARAQQSSRPTIGYFSSRSPGSEEPYKTAFRQGLKETGYVDGDNVTIEYRFSNGQEDELPEIAAELLRRQVAVLVATDGPSSLAAKGATATTPIVFSAGGDPVKFGLVDSLNRPGANATGVFVFVSEIGPKRLQLVREVVPQARLIAYIVNLKSGSGPSQLQAIQAAAKSMGQEIVVLNAATESEIEEAFATLADRKAGAIVYSANKFFQVARDKLVALAARYAIPAIYEWPEFVQSGGLMSYSSTRLEAGWQMGSYVGQIFKGAKPGDLPVIQSSKFELAINLKTAKALGITFPLSLLGRADEVIE
jgi:putative tryptophan/tyrosine transport system substrate-binding protein